MQILTRISYDISLGLYHGIQQDKYLCSLPWLKALESCIKNNFFNLAQFICVHLLPRGSQSLEDISILGRALIESNDKDLKHGCNHEWEQDGTEPQRSDPEPQRDGPEPHRGDPEPQLDGPEPQRGDPELAGNDSERKRDDSEQQQNICTGKLFSYFTGFHSLVLLYKMWWQVCQLLKSNDSKDSNNTTDINGFSRELSDIVPPFNVAETIASESNAHLEETNVADTGLNEDGSPNKEPLPASLHSSGILALSSDLLRESAFACTTLKEQLLEVKKEIILLRSRRILDSVAAASSSKQKRTTKKKQKAKQALEEANEGEESVDSSVQDSEVIEAAQKQENNERGWLVACLLAVVRIMK